MGGDAGPVPDERRAELRARGPVHAGASGLALLGDAETIVKEPGVPAQAPVVAAAREAGIGVIGELELGWRLVPTRRSRSRAQRQDDDGRALGHLHRRRGLPVVVVGNVGTALSSLVGSGLPEATIVVCEASSFQLEDTQRFAADAGVLLNLAEDHLDRHGTFDAYRAAKLEVFTRQPRGTVAVAPDMPWPTSCPARPSGVVRLRAATRGSPTATARCGGTRRA